MTDNNKIQASLTEQWKKGELPEGWYWVKIKTWCEYIDMLYYTSDIFLDGDVPVDNEKIIEVLAPVPTFDELQDMNKAVNECMAANIKLVEENKRLKHDVGNLGYKIKNQRHEIDNRLKEIEKLKDLLKKVKDYLPEFETPMNILAKIDEALK